MAVRGYAKVALPRGECRSSKCGDIPRAEILILCRGEEDGSHRGDFSGVPSADVLVEVCSSLEHGCHVYNLSGVPCRDVLIKSSCTVKHGGCIDVSGGATQQPIQHCNV